MSDIVDKIKYVAGRVPIEPPVISALTLDAAAEEIERLRLGILAIQKSKDHAEAVFLCSVVLGGPEMKVSTVHEGEGP